MEMETKDLAIIIIVIVVAIALVGIFLFVALSPPAGLDGPAGALAGQTDLRVLFEPIILAHGNPETACIAAGGIWHYEPGFVGCVATRVPIVDCSNPLYQSAMLQCAALGNTEATCDPNNTFCRYV